MAQWNLWMNGLVGFGVVLVISALSRPILALYGLANMGGEWVIVLSNLGGAVFAIAYATHTTLIASGAAGSNIVIHLVNAGVVVALALWTIPAHGALGYAVAYTGGSLAMMIAGLWLIRRRLADFGAEPASVRPSAQCSAECLLKSSAEEATNAMIEG